MTPTPTATGTAPLPPPPLILDGQEVYDMLMGQIERDLVTAQLPLLKETYKDETPEQSKARAERYNRAFAEYDKQYAAYIKQQEQQLQGYQRNFLSNLQTLNQSTEESGLDEISAAIS